ncbi:MAG TPA: DMT family transporter [Verrucomicrobiae bacterium]|nr:DMT family transporter [Verrucomicrobiae bacterium]
MIWAAFASVAAVTVSAEAIIEKGVLRREDPGLFSAIVMVLSGCIVLPFLWIVDWSKLTLPVLAWIMLCSLVMSTAFFLATRSMKHMEISLFAPMSTITPAFVAIIAALTLGETLGRGQWVGIFLLVFGGYCLQLKPGQSWLYPCQRLIQCRDLHYLAVALLLYPIASVMGRYTFTRLGILPYHYLVLMRIFAAMYFLLYIHFRRGGFKAMRKHIPRHKGAFFWISLLNTTNGAALSLALAGAYVVKVLAVVKLSSLVTTIVGGGMFHEHYMLRKTIACIVMLVGVAWVVFG